MATRAKKTVEAQESVDLAPLQKELDDLKKEVAQLKKQLDDHLKSQPKSSGGSSALAQQIVDSLKEMTGPNTKGVRNYIRSVFK